MKQIVVVSRNKVGVIADISRVLSGKGINIERLDTSGLSSHGAVVIATDSYDKALKALNDSGFKAVSEESIVVRLKNEPGSLAAVSGRLRDSEVDIRSMHIISRDGDYSLVALATPENEKARELLKDVIIG
ncbi:MAG: hypothetical protein ACR2NQ_01215 [Thermodesulfobacteriota bacterium]